MRKKAKGCIVLIIAIGILILCTVYTLISNRFIDVENVDVHIKNLPGNLKALKIVQVSDLHIPKNMIGINEILKTIRGEKPDIIVMTGDIVDEYADIEDSRIIDFYKGLVEIAKTYAVSGNHEEWNGFMQKKKSILSKMGLNVLDNDIDIFVGNNKKLAIMGLRDGNSYSADRFKNYESVIGLPKILLVHRPELFYEHNSDSNLVIPDLVFSGHAHGGQFRIPFINRGVIAPGQGYFPKYTSGIYPLDHGVQLAMSRGLGNSVIPVRINNRPHLLVVRLE